MSDKKIIKSIFCKTYYRGLFLNLGDGLYVKIAEKDGSIVFGKLTTSFRHNISITDAVSEFRVPIEYLQFYESIYDKLRVIWNVNYNDHKIGDLYLPEDLRKVYPHNHVCHHIGYYRRNGSRAIYDSWKLGVAGLNVEKFNKFRLNKKNI